MNAKSKGTLLIPVQRSIKKLGNDMQSARRRRRIGTKLMAERAGISRTTLRKIETGEPGVSLGNYVTVLFILGMVDRVSDLADIANDTLGHDLEEELLPKRIRTKPYKPE